MINPTRKSGNKKLRTQLDTKLPHTQPPKRERKKLPTQLLTQNHGLSHIAKEIMPGMSLNTTNLTKKNGKRKPIALQVTRSLHTPVSPTKNQPKVPTTKLRIPIHGLSHTSKESTPGVMTSFKLPTSRLSLMTSQMDMIQTWFSQKLIQ